MSDELLKQLEDAIVEIQPDHATALMEKIMDATVPAIDILNRALVPALDRVGVLFREGDYFLPDVLMSVNIYNQAFALIEPELKAGNYKAKGTVMLGTVKGDTHDIGKNILSALLQGNGFEVINLGMNVAAETFLEKAREARPDIIGMSALLTTTMPEMKNTLDLFEKEGLRSDFRFIVGGAPVTQDYADQIGADGYGEEAQAGVALVKSLLA